MKPETIKNSNFFLKVLIYNNIIFYVLHNFWCLFIYHSKDTNFLQQWKKNEKNKYIKKKKEEDEQKKSRRSTNERWGIYIKWCGENLTKKNESIYVDTV
jgi:midasin (ATPase involved in ribosome maturation)